MRANSGGHACELRWPCMRAQVVMRANSGAHACTLARSCWQAPRATATGSGGHACKLRGHACELRGHACELRGPARDLRGLASMFQTSCNWAPDPRSSRILDDLLSCGGRHAALEEAAGAAAAACRRGPASRAGTKPIPMDHMVPPPARLLGAAPRSFRRHGEDFGGSSGNPNNAMGSCLHAAHLHPPTCVLCRCLRPRSAWRVDPSQWRACRRERRDVKTDQKIPGRRRRPLNGGV